MTRKPEDAQPSASGNPEAAETNPPLEGALDALVELEERIEAELLEAEAEGARMIEQARQEAQRLSQEGSQVLEASIRALAAALEEEAGAAERSLRESAEAELKGYQDVDEVTIQRLARWVAARVASGSDAT